ncbi:MAG: helix-turn-helix domain-containing protein [Candidatus Omnitrophica bacterium]|nr:helix-turn-helix domain-containing protein [Candidatus Omnitrophota bacterium]MBU0896666.1 helix-turn-helix domain-containing protein [Candidatus Omnitrophota bacterium]MBU1134567.1 helix-turn-helix domain-containing protein [Candidatus Omnitrophota bacterium]MBU1366406.1 helix-turn-helix domain-containing protein [Candidatus Omnitrophota bacterium]MBU1523468.1 helix-turn-helix domain-containing protein [Candidatus Omnitrophota bacterium]
MKKVDDYIKARMEKDPDFEARYDLIKQKANVVKTVIEYRNKHNLSQAELAAQLGVTQQYISKIEEGEFSNLETVENLLNHIGYHLKLVVVRIHGGSHKAHRPALA